MQEGRRESSDPLRTAETIKIAMAATAGYTRLMKADPPKPWFPLPYLTTGGIGIRRPETGPCGLSQEKWRRRRRLPAEQASIVRLYDFHGGRVESRAPDRAS